MAIEILEALLQAIEHNEPAALATIVEVTGSAPAPVGAKMLIWPDGRTTGTVGGGTLEQAIIDDAQAALSESQSRFSSYSLREDGQDSVGMLCGGEVQVFIEVYSAPPTLLLIGGGHVGQPLAEMARQVGFRVEIVDIDPERRSVEELANFPISQDTYIVIMTAEANADEEALRLVVETPAAYIGMIGSRRKVAIILEHLRDAGIDEDALTRVRAPIGLNLGGQTPSEIALSVVAEMVAVRYKRNAQPLSRL
jgi:xanthine dehydrogenase accessory factor